MSKFKVGDKVRRKKGTGDSCFAEEGIIYEVEKTGDTLYLAGTQCGLFSGCQSKWELVEKTLDNLEVGDVLCDPSGYEREVLGVCGKMVFSSNILPSNLYGTAWTISELKQQGYKIKQPSKERTVEDILSELSEEDKEIIKSKLK